MKDTLLLNFADQFNNLRKEEKENILKEAENVQFWEYLERLKYGQFAAYACRM